MKKSLEVIKELIDAIEYADKGENKKAIELLNSILKKDPENFLANYILGIIYKLEGDFEKANECFEKIFLNNFSQLSCNNLICVNFILGNAHKVLYYAEKLEKTKKKCVCVSNFHKALIYMESMEYEKALEELDKLLEVNNKFILAWRFKAEIYKNLGRFEEALTCIEKVIELGGKNSASWMLKGEILENLGKLKEALKAYYVALELNKNLKFLYKKVGYLELTQGNYNEAIKYLGEYLNNYKDVEGKYYLALAYEKTKDYKKALDLYSEVIEELENKKINEVILTNSLIRKAKLLEILGKLEEALELYNKALN
ncbi:Tetratricopeptide TPR_2 repeat protein [Methanocaldococcus infernus ME]|uniref:Tetratricopeptide TPR_2 repeat protein n=1 Tax=Methanocaldococcus infernus (strain DSM 11812 / JCM 15783 / ME) TaxID=573063 RepID=D5VTB3_METIM|nr:Tetratricopeptide TPR_2 repeat protein [Methanocaldococcus infernus ME]